MTTAGLFECLPVQMPPATLYTDAHVLFDCLTCNGTGVQRCWYPRSHPVSWNWDPTCRGCGGGGKLLRRWYGLH